MKYFNLHWIMKVNLLPEQKVNVCFLVLHRRRNTRSSFLKFTPRYHLSFSKQKHHTNAAAFWDLNNVRYGQLPQEGFFSPFQHWIAEFYSTF